MRTVTSSAKKVLEDALVLPEDDRRRIAERLAPLDEVVPLPQPEVPPQPIELRAGAQSRSPYRRVRVGPRLLGVNACQAVVRS